MYEGIVRKRNECIHILKFFHLHIDMTLHFSNIQHVIACDIKFNFRIHPFVCETLQILHVLFSLEKQITGRTRSTSLAACYADQLPLLRWKMQAPQFSTTRTIVWITGARTAVSNTITNMRTRKRKPSMNCTSIVSILVCMIRDIIYCLCWAVQSYLDCLFTLVRPFSFIIIYIEDINYIFPFYLDCFFDE